MTTVVSLPPEPCQQFQQEQDAALLWWFHETSMSITQEYFFLEAVSEGILEGSRALHPVSST